MIHDEPFSLPSNMKNTFNIQQVHEPISNPSSNPNSNPSKKKRSLPGNPDPDAEVIALSPKSLMATNRFVCEICKKGFQRDQNLQLHLRGHNLPWKLKQRNKQEVIKKKVYVCPEKSCVHHDPFRALGDLTGIKKHYSRKHGEKKWKCNKCSKKYAVQSDWKAHSKICGTKEYKCECGTTFSRRDGFITHRAFCGALAEQSARLITSVPSVFNFRNDQAPRIPHSLPGFHQEFSGQGSEPLIGNFVDSEHALKLRLPLWLDQTNSNVYSSNEVVQTMNMNMNMNMSGSNFSHHHHSLSSSLYSSAQNLQGGPTHMSTRINDNAIFNNNSNNVFGLNNNIVEMQKVFKQGNQEGQNFNNMVVSSSLNDANCTSFGNLDHMVMPTVDEDQLGLTRDFLGVGDETLRTPFLQHQQQLHNFNPIHSVLNLHSHFNRHHNMMK
ncbi:PREDICTED: protein indeterminate-domain 9-like isoform X2 [Lupinus angustifolius]|uniref:protein indeterminate-domain 9-like isoform X2 n=1 Tax=Lupinus angustifolius TaxID=3871 RepID=UPI00092E4E0D|nr:PREDICTED: protein indeterminate-domain 9-like isoform X2 [Lupinus angustifolius]